MVESSDRKDLALSRNTSDVSTFADFIEGSNISIGHLRIAAGTFGIAAAIDRIILKTRHHRLIHGEAIKAMAPNGLGFLEQRLYLHPEFFAGITVGRLLDDGITTGHLNGDILGRTLDAIATYSPTELFNEIVAKRLLASKHGTQSASISIPPPSASVVSTGHATF